jgi:hypothetical protein
MTKDYDRNERRLDDLFGDAEIISSYSSRQAVADGVFFDVTELSKVSPSTAWKDGPFSYVTSNLCYSKGYLKDGEPPRVANFLDLFRTVQEHMRVKGPDHFYNVPVEFPDGTTGEVYASLNEHDKYTLMMPEDY